MLYIIQGDDNSVIISGYHPDSPEFEANSWELTDARSCNVATKHRLPGSTLRNVIVNIFKDAEISFQDL